MRTSLCGVFACGDARSNPLKQLAMAVGDGALAAVQAQRYLDELDCAMPGSEAHRPVWGGPPQRTTETAAAAASGGPATP
jgi:hypothetical protein